MITVLVLMDLALCVVAWLLWRSRRRAVAAASEARRLLERTRSEREWFEQVLGSITEEVYFTDTAGRYRYVNHAVLNQFGHEKVEGVPVASVVAPLEVYRADGSPRPVEEAPPLRALRGEVVRDEEQIVRIPRTGELRHRQVSSAPVRDDAGKIIGSVSVVRDITDRRRIEDALREADHRKTVFIATLSHELRNPLAPIRAAARVLELPAANAADIARARGIIVRQVAQMASLLDDLLDASRFMRGDLVLRRQRVPLQQVLDAAIETAQPMLAAKRHCLQVQLPDSSPIIDVDPVRFTQVVSNLLGNAAKYTDDGGTITLACAIDGGRLAIAVSDTGVGISAASIGHIFTMFVQLDPGRTRAQGGLGIGLALVKAIMELHGGTVRARSDGLGRGSTFTLEFPAGVIVDGNVEAPGPAGTVTSSPRRILVADDNADAAQSLAMLIGMSGHDVHVAGDGPTALDAAIRLRPDIVLLDIGMPGMSGYDVARAIRSQPWGSTLTLVALTGWGQIEDREAAMQAGFDLHFTKPVEPASLEAVLARGRT